MFLSAPNGPSTHIHKIPQKIKIKSSGGKFKGRTSTNDFGSGFTIEATLWLRPHFSIHKNINATSLKHLRNLLTKETREQDPK
jgi:hypothetical protein